MNEVERETRKRHRAESRAVLKAELRSLKVKAEGGDRDALVEAIRMLSWAKQDRTISPTMHGRMRNEVKAWTGGAV